MTSAQKIYSVALIACLVGCADQGDIHPLGQALPPNELNLSPGLTTSAPMPTTSWAWWLALADPQLDVLMTQALAQNPDLAIARARLRQADGLSAIAAAQLSPLVDLDTHVGRAHWTNEQFFPPPFGGSQTWNNAINLSASYSLDLWGLNRESATAAEDGSKVRIAERQAALLLVSGEMVQTYLRYAESWALQDLLQGVKDNAEQTLRIERVRFGRGLTDAESMHSAERSSAQIDGHLASVAGDMQLQAERIAVLTGRGTATDQPLQRPGMRLSNDWSAPTEVPADLIGKRPDVQARRWRMEASAHEIKAARAAFYPNINLAAYFGGLAASGGFMEFMKPDSAHYGITPALSLPIFDGGRLRGQLLAQTGAFDEAVAQYNKTLLTALQQAAEALTRLNTLSERRRSVNDDLHAACGNRSIAERRFHAGLTNRLPVLAAESEILRLQAQTLSLNTDAIDALTRLFTALGGAVIPNTLPGAQS